LDRRKIPTEGERESTIRKGGGATEKEGNAWRRVVEGQHHMAKGGVKFWRVLEGNRPHREKEERLPEARRGRELAERGGDLFGRGTFALPSVPSPQENSANFFNEKTNSKTKKGKNYAL